MKRLLSTSAALALALAPVQPWPLYAQTLAEDGSVIGPDVSIGDNVVVENAIFRDSIVDAGATIESAMLTRSLVGRDAIVRGEPATAEAPPAGWERVIDGIGVVDLNCPPELMESSFSQLRLFVGLSGWAAGQLESELIRGSWFRAPARPEDVFGHPAGLWRRVLRRLGGATGRWINTSAARVIGPEAACSAQGGPWITDGQS